MTVAVAATGAMSGLADPQWSVPRLGPWVPRADVLPLQSGRLTTRRTLVDVRRSAGLTVCQLARKLHISRPTLSGWEKGSRRPAGYHRRALATILGLTEEQVDDLFSGYPPARLDGEPLPSLARVRRRAGVTQRTLAQLVGVAPTTLSMWETAGVSVPARTTVRLAQALGVEVATLTAQRGPDPTEDLRPLRHMRREAGMSQREAAAHLGIAVGSLARYEAGERRPPVPVARRMAAAYRRRATDVLAASDIELLPLPPGVRWSPEDVPGGLRAARTAAGLTKVALGRAVGRSGQAIHSWETGRSRPRADVCRCVEVVLGLPQGKLPF